MNQVKVQGLTYLVKSAGNNFLSKLRRSRPRTNPAPSVSCRQSILSDPPPFTISQSCINEGEKLQAASSRDPYLPAIYEVKSHPRIPKGLDKDVIKWILVIPWPKGDAQYLKFYFHYAETKIHIPGGTNSIIPALGKLIVYYALALSDGAFRLDKTQCRRYTFHSRCCRVWRWNGRFI